MVRRLIRYFSFVTLVVVLVGTNFSANAQFLDFLGGFFRGSAKTMPPDDYPRDGRSIEGGVSSRTGYCVRICDGAFFPLSKVESRSTPEQLCGALCPGTQTKVFFGSQIDSAVAKSGEAYSKLKNAFLYRQERVSQCACTSDGEGFAIIDVKSDPTLKPGDIVITEDGPLAFKGSSAS